jgi:hypothetical protein
VLEEEEDLPDLLPDDFDDELPVVEEPAPVLAEVFVPVFPVVDFEAEEPALVEEFLLVEPEELLVPEALSEERPEVPEELFPALDDMPDWEPELPAPMLACEPVVLPELCEPDEPLIPEEEDDDEPEFVFES